MENSLTFVAGQGAARLGWAGRGEVWLRGAGPGGAWRGKALRGEAGQGTARQGEAKLGEARIKFEVT